jgi:hypothetical protein
MVFLTRYYAGDQMKKMRWVGHMGHIEENRNAYRVLMGKPEGKRPLRRCRWVNNMKIDLRELR